MCIVGRELYHLPTVCVIVPYYYINDINVIFMLRNISSESNLFVEKALTQRVNKNWKFNKTI